jgi:hypothetical protein
MDMCLQDKRKAKVVEKGGGSYSTRSTDYHMASYHLDQVSGALSWPYKYPPSGENQNTHTITWKFHL